MPVIAGGAQRASKRWSFRPIVIAALAAVLATGGLGAQPAPVAAAGPKVVLIVGPAGSRTADYIRNARKLAAQARGYGATVSEIYSPNATWSRVVEVLQGAKLVIYLGHGNGWPSPYPPFEPERKDGFGLNPFAGSGNYTTRYYGEAVIARSVKLAPNAVVILNRLCYASGNSEWGRANPTRSTAIKRVDNFGAGFLRAGARAVFAHGIDSAGSIISGLFGSDRTMSGIFWASPAATRAYSFSFASVRTPGMKALMDPYAPGRYYRSVIGDLAMTAGDWRG